jgi:hypothetical protein
MSVSGRERSGAAVDRSAAKSEPMSDPANGFKSAPAVGFEAYSEDADLAPFFKWRPNDECQCEHMGYVIRGNVGFRSGVNEELFEAGDTDYVGSGHTPMLYAGTEVAEVSPSEELGRTMEVAIKNVEEMEASA